ncbi:Arrestin-N domain-containing protein [Mycena sanguinolenta]|uniref:Arrestin-N domain-containing protein n=1 Tax=Mycena sanguinolenta TaxID=230812 RepID=A0A8H7CQE6_9AGAR|nr:Arrestin-N domain-containing protein [Mycena sanguinolenta]
MATSQPIALHFQSDPIRRVAGETIAGSVDLNIARAQEEHIEKLRIEFRGAITTQVTEQNPGRAGATHRAVVPLIHSDQVLWTQRSAVSAADSHHNISLAFQFKLPANLPPSFHCHDSANGHDESSPLCLQPRRTSCWSKKSLQQGWAGGWGGITRDRQLRQGIWGEYSRAAVTLSLPDLPSFPIATPIPCRLHIVTETKTMDRTERPEDKRGKPLFPVPPTESAKLHLKLQRTTHVWASYKLEHVKDTFDIQPVRNSSEDSQQRNVKAEWVPKKDSKDRGFWRRSVDLNTTFDFPFAPTTSTTNLAWNYKIQLIIPFPGLGNDLKIELPIHLGASASAPLPPPPISASGTSSLASADVLPAGTPPTLDRLSSSLSGTTLLG